MLINAAIMIFNIAQRKVHLSTVANGARPEEEETRHESLNESKCTHHNLLHMFRKRSNKITKKKSKRFGARETNENQEDATFFKAFFLICIVCLIIVSKMCVEHFIIGLRQVFCPLFRLTFLRFEKNSSAFLPSKISSF